MEKDGERQQAAVTKLSSNYLTVLNYLKCSVQPNVNPEIYFAQKAGFVIHTLSMLVLDIISPISDRTLKSVASTPPTLAY
jgi:hypothetical protein